MHRTSSMRHSVANECNSGNHKDFFLCVWSTFSVVTLSHIILIKHLWYGIELCAIQYINPEAIHPVKLSHEKCIGHSVLSIIIT